MKCSKCGFLRANEDGSCPSCGAGPAAVADVEKSQTIDEPKPKKRSRKKKTEG